MCGVGTHREIFHFLFIYLQNCVAWEDIVWFSSFFLFIYRTVWRGNTSCDFLLSLYLSTELCGVGTHRVIFFFLFIYPQNCAAWEHIMWFSSFSLFVHRTVCRGKTSCEFLFLFIFQQKPGAVARSDARPPGMRTVAGSILRSGKTFFRKNLVMKKYFYGHSLPFADLRRTVVSYWRKS